MRILLIRFGMLRIAFYSHDTFGLGHIRRCLKLSQAIQSAFVDLEGLLITGSPWAHLFPCPTNLEILRLPPIVKRGSAYRPLTAGLNLASVLKFRRRRLTETLLSFSPDLMIVDNVPCGLRGEMLEALQGLRASNKTRCVLALRDVLDRPDRVAKEWATVGAAEALESLYHEVWIFGDQGDVDQMMELPGMSDANRRVCGRIGIGSNLSTGEPEIRKEQKSEPILHPPRVLVTGGGGGDSSALVSTYVDMLRSRKQLCSHVILGPDFPSEIAGQIRRDNGFRARIDSFVADVPAAMEQSDLVVSMAGYNTICEIEALGKRAVLVPRVWPRDEQLLRARKQEEDGRAIVLHPSELTPEGLWRSIQQSLQRPAPARISHPGAWNAALSAAELLDREIDVELVRKAS